MAAAIQGGRPRRTLGQWIRASVLGLQCKSTVLVVALTLCVATVVGGLFVHFAGRLTAKNQERHATQLCAGLAQLAADALAQRDWPHLQRVANKFASGDPLIFVSFCDAQGRSWASASRNDLPIDPAWLQLGEDARRTVGQPLLRYEHPGVPTFLDVSYPINRALAATDGGPSPLLGYVRVGFNVDPTLKEFAGVMDLVSGIALVVVLITIPFAFLVVRQIVVPLNELSLTAEKLAQGDRSARSRVSRTDEIGQLARSFNHMADEIDRNEKKITAMNADLEERVRDRTRQLKEMAARDPLTGLYNRRHVDEVLARSFAEAKRYGHPLSCLMIDLDNFKAVNDRFGHHAGDQALMLAADTVSGELRASDIAARFGGDEFVVLLPHAEQEQAAVLARRIADRFASNIRAALPTLRTRLSIGIASLGDGDADRPEGLVRAADRALYAAKQRGRNRIEISRVPV